MFNSHYLAENIKKYRKLKKFSQSSFADILGVSPQSVSKWECGISVPDVENLCFICDILGISLDTLLEHCAEHKKIMIGIDGGASKTEFLIFNEDGIILDDIKLGACNPNAVGIDGCVDILSQGIRTLLLSNPNISAVHVGAAGFLLGNNLASVLGALKKAFPQLKFQCQSDMFNIAASALENDKSCIGVICGTGSSVIIKDGDSLTRLSGYGYLLGKAGSGYDIGRDALYAVLCHMDGYGEETMLTELIQKKLGNSVSDIIDKVYKNNASFTASVARYVFEAFRKGDSVATRIITENASAVAELVNTAHKMHPAITNVIFNGGIITCNSDFEQLVCDRLVPGLTVTIPKAAPVLGACILCARMNNVETKGLLKKLTEQYKEKRFGDA